jgi:hypothetical protein
MRTIIEHPLYASKKQEFVSAWLARYGSGWIDVEFPDEFDEYFTCVVNTLTKMGKLHIVSTFEGKARLKLIKDE